MGCYDSYSLLHGFELSIHYASLELLFYNSRLMNQDSIEFPQVHSCYEIYMVIECTINLSVDHQIYSLTTEDICWISPGIEHEIISGTSKYQYIFLSFDFIPNNIPVNTKIAETEMTILLQYANKYKFWVGKDVQNCRTLFEYLCEELDRCDFGCYIKICNLISSFVVSAIRNMKLNLLSYYDMFTSISTQNRFNQLMGYLRQHYCEEITMQSTASFMNISTRHINRILNEHFGMTFKKMLVYMRISKTKHYLFTTNYSIEKISELVGFSSPRILGKQFKEIENITLSQFRQNNKQD